MLRAGWLYNRAVLFIRGVNNTISQRCRGGGAESLVIAVRPLQVHLPTGIDPAKMDVL